MYNSAALGATITDIRLENFFTISVETVPINDFPFLSSPQLRSWLYSTFCFYEFPSLGTSYKWNHMVFVLLQLTYSVSILFSRGFPGGSVVKNLTCHCRTRKRQRFNPQVGKIPWRRAWQPTAVFLPGESLDRGAWWATVLGSRRVGHDWSDLAPTHTLFSRFAML